MNPEQLMGAMVYSAIVRTESGQVMWLAGTPDQLQSAMELMGRHGDVDAAIFEHASYN